MRAEELLVEAIEAAEERSLYEQGNRLKLSGHEGHYTACSVLVIFKNSCCKLHCRKVLIRSSFYISLLSSLM